MFGLSKFGMRRWLLDKSADGGEGAGKGKEEKTDDSTGEEETLGDAGDKKKKDITFTAEQQILVDRLVGDARKKEREKAKSEAAAEADREKKKADEEALAKNQEWKTLADTRAEELTTLTKERDDLLEVQKQAEKYKTTLNTMLAETKKSLPKHLIELLDKMDPVEALEYIAKNAKELKVSAAAYPETPEEKEHKITKEEESVGQQANQKVIASSF